MIPLIAKKLFMAGAITVVLPFTTFTVTSAGAGAVQNQFPAVNSGVSSNTSYNWSGYESTGGTYTAVSGTWTIPSVQSATSTEADATWVGIGGTTGKDLIQAGTQAVINGSGAPTYQAWYEMLPQTTQQVSLTVSPGDSISVSLSETSTNEWLVTLRDNTTGQSYQTTLNYASSLSSAEWIQEMPSDGNSFVPLDNFGSVPFTSGMTIDNGNSVSIAGSNAQALTMVNPGGQVLASPSALGSDGESFTVTRSSVQATSGSTYIVTRGAVGRGWRRTGVGIQRYQPSGANPATSVVSGGGSGSASGTGFGSGSGFTQFSFPGGDSLQRLYQILEQLQQQQAQQLQQVQGSYFKNGGRFGR